MGSDQAIAPHRVSESIMSKQFYGGRGSKRKVRLIRWKRREIISLIFLLIVMSILAVSIAVWFEAHHTD